MYLLDTDHLTTLQRGGESAQRLLTKLAIVSTREIATTVVSYEEQLRGWLSYIAKSRSIDAQVEAYRQLKNQLKTYCTIPVLEFNPQAAIEFKRLKKAYPRLGAMDLKIAAIALAKRADLLTRNLSDFGQIENLSAEDWTA